MSVVNFELSPWFIPLCLLVAAALTYLLYSKSSPWSKNINLALSALRFCLFSLLAVLLLNPLFKQFTQQVENPLAVIAIDNSESMTNSLDSAELTSLMKGVGNLQTELLGRNYTVELRSFDGVQNDGVEISFTHKTSNIKSWLDEIKSEKEGTNLARMFLISDGVYNQGISPAYFPYQVPIHAIGVGDTIQKSDLVLKNIYFNKIAYQGNRFPVVVEVANYGFNGDKTEVQIWQGGKLVFSKPVIFKKDQELQTLSLDVEAKAQGYQRLRVVIRPLDKEEVIVNNSKSIYVDVVDGKQKILLVAPAPHPDMKALASVIAQNENYELITFIPGITEYKKDKYDLLIWHTSYDRWSRCEKYVKVLKKEGVPILHFIGNMSNLNRLNQEEESVAIIQQRNQRDQILGALNPDFKKFAVADLIDKNWSNFPPLNVPYADYVIPLNADVLLYQKVGSVSTDKPLLFVSEQNDKKEGFFMAENIWKWRMQEYALNETSEVFDDLFLKVIQYLSTKVDKRKFRFSSIENEYFTNDLIQFQSELYNEIYDRIYNEEINVVIKNDAEFRQDATFIPTSSTSKLEISGLGQGSYNYEATTVINDKKEIVRGDFLVKELELEKVDQVADFRLLRQMAENSGGSFTAYDPTLDNFIEGITSFDDKNIIHTEEEVLPIVHIRWILFLLLLLVTLEWLVRKYQGGY